MKMSVGVTLQHDARRLPGLWRDGRTSCSPNCSGPISYGFNNLRFDYEVLHGYTVIDLRQIPTLDMLGRTEQHAGPSPHARFDRDGDLGLEKDRRWLAGHPLVQTGPPARDRVEHCCYDVKRHAFVHEYGVKHRQFLIKTASARNSPCRVKCGRRSTVESSNR